MATAKQPNKKKKNTPLVGTASKYGSQSTQKNLAEENLLRHKLNDLEHQKRKSIQAISDQEKQILRDLQRREGSMRREGDKAINAIMEWNCNQHASRSPDASNSSSRRGSLHSVDLHPVESETTMLDAAKYRAKVRRHSLDTASLRTREFTSVPSLDNVFDAHNMTTNSRQLKLSSQSSPQTRRQAMTSSQRSLDSELNQQMNTDTEQLNHKTVSFAENSSQNALEKQDFARKRSFTKLMPISRDDRGKICNPEHTSPSYLLERNAQQTPKQDFGVPNSLVSNVSPAESPRCTKKNQHYAQTLQVSDNAGFWARPKTSSGLVLRPKQPPNIAANKPKLEPLRKDSLNPTADIRALCSEATVNRLKFLHGDSAGNETKVYKKLGNGEREGLAGSNVSSEENGVKLHWCSSFRDVNSRITKTVREGAASALPAPISRRKNADADRYLTKLTGDSRSSDTLAQWDDLGKYLDDFRKQHNMRQNSLSNNTGFPRKTRDGRSLPLPETELLPDDQSKLLPRRHSDGNFLLLANAMRTGHALRAKYSTSKNRQQYRSSDHPCGSPEYQQRNTSVKKLASMHGVLQSSALSMVEAEPEMF